MAVFTFTALLLLCGMFVTSGLAKMTRGDFTSDLANYRLLPPRLVVRVGRALPAAEVVVGVGLLVGALPSIFLGAAALLLAFAAAVAVNLRRGRSIACGCRGGVTPIRWRIVITNLVLAAAAVVGIGVSASGVLPTLLGDAPGLQPTDAFGMMVIVAVVVVMVQVMRLWGSLNGTVERVEDLVHSGLGR